jgi:hypothetical protein
VQANEKTLNIDNVNVKRGYELRNSVFPEFYTYTAILLTTCIAVIVTRYRL